MPKNKGKLIVIYGLNNLGKTTQAKLLVKNLNKNGCRAEYAKYPRYDILPTGKMITDYLRADNPYGLSSREIQIIYAFNRQQAQTELKNKLKEGINIIAECYIGTGLAWGAAAGVESLFLRHINSHLHKEDLAFHFTGRRFDKAREKKHRHENNDDLSRKTKTEFDRLAREFSWINISANEKISVIEKMLFKYTVEFLYNRRYLGLAPNFIYPNGRAAGIKDEIGREDKSPTIRIKRLTPMASMPKKDNNYNYNLYSQDYYSVMPGEKIRLSTGLEFRVPENYLGLVISSLGGFSCVVDSKTRSELFIHWRNSTGGIRHIQPGDKIGQVMFQKLAEPKIIHN